MYQSRARKPSANVLKPAGLPAPNDIKECRVNVDETRKRSKSKYCIPKNLRYDLENALVNLCDVWFEEIKPYLVRNNVKVHVQDDEANTGSGGNNCTTPDAVKLTRNRSAIPERTNCSHLDPASSSSWCTLCRLLYNASCGIESAIAQAAVAAPPAAAPAAASAAAHVADTAATVIGEPQQ
ncbi:PREDICTED: uncharacterized protein LOC106100513 isoform X2 [Papilio polytes]|uniref:uncharacterized protein LOC106100513 isoform X2 n=1 Tax=Papilio polytes TaxID=76194 RepID=UPI0006762FF1|nr:PREDICTED: uncharacterized protein LOC106100513 isoform X2 [Papilio polytes]